MVNNVLFVGYSVSSGRFFDGRLYYVGGAPRLDSKGKVI